MNIHQMNIYISFITTVNCSDKRCECCNYLLINDHYTFKNVQVTFKLKSRFTCDSFNLIYVAICGTCK